MGRAVDGAVDKEVDEAVDKHHFLGRTARVLWMNCGWPKNLGISGRTPLCGPRQGRRNALTAGDGYRPGGDLGDAARAGKPAIDVGIWDRQQVSSARRPSNRCAGAAAGRGPSISYMEGPRPILPDMHPAGRHRHAGDCGSQPPRAGRRRPGEMSFLAVNTRPFNCPHSLRPATPPKPPANPQVPTAAPRPVTARGALAGGGLPCPAARRAGQPSDCAGRVGRPAAFHAWKPPSRSVARRPIRRRLAAARVEA
jgi:hypothetical protein